MSKHRPLLLLALFFAPAAFNVHAQSSQPAQIMQTTYGACDTTELQNLVSRYQAKQKDLDQTLEPLWKRFKEIADNSLMDMSSCVDMSFPTLKITYPTMDQIIRGVAKQAVNKFCGEAREKISDATSKLNQSFYINTRIPGVSSYGVSTSTSGNGGVVVNGNPVGP